MSCDATARGGFVLTLGRWPLRDNFQAPTDEHDKSENVDHSKHGKRGVPDVHARKQQMLRYPSECLLNRSRVARQTEEPKQNDCRLHHYSCSARKRKQCAGRVNARGLSQLGSCDTSFIPSRGLSMRPPTAPRTNKHLSHLSPIRVLFRSIRCAQAPRCCHVTARPGLHARALARGARTHTNTSTYRDKKDIVGQFTQQMYTRSGNRSCTCPRPA